MPPSGGGTGIETGRQDSERGAHATGDTVMGSTLIGKEVERSGKREGEIIEHL